MTILSVEGQGDAFWLVERKSGEEPVKLARFISLEAALAWKFAHKAQQQPKREKQQVWR